MNLNDPIKKHINQITQTRQEDLKKGGFHTIRDLLYHFPVRFEEAVELTAAAEKNTLVDVSGVIKKIVMRRSRGKKRMMIAEASIETSHGVLRAVWFNQPYIAKQYPEKTPVRIRGKIGGTKKSFIANPVIEKETDTAIDTARDIFTKEGETSSKEISLNPIYSTTGTVSSLWLTETIKKMLPKIRKDPITDPIPESVRSEYNLPDLVDALHYIHSPPTLSDYEAACKRFAFEYVFLLKIKQSLARNKRTHQQSFQVDVDDKKLKEYIKKLSYTLTQAQEKAIKDVVHDIRKDIPMTRLLEGDVGSGKTAVAAVALMAVAQSIHPSRPGGFLQGVYMAPTEVLARQQFITLCELLKDSGVACALITSSGCEKFPSKEDPSKPTSVSKRQMNTWMEEGAVRVIVGTHALIQKNVAFRDCALVIIDEQHRFGVAQRYALTEKNDIKPHVLSMSATPIPRTLALTIYGDLDLSVIDELPPGRKTAKTTLVKPKDIQKVYNTMRKEIEKGRQVFIVCPRIEETEKSDIASIQKTATEIKEEFPDRTIDIIHGKNKKEEQQESIRRFVDGDTDILIATTVVEVGVNIPNATCIVIQDADRFGLAQLHQLRGRVTRSNHTPYCFAVTKSANPDTLARLQHFEEYTDGFILAEKDLETRGGGEIDGLRQSGISDLAMTALQNTKLVDAAHTAATRIVDTDPSLTEYPALKKELTIKQIID